MECVQRERSDSRSIETGVCVSHSLFHCPPASHTHPRTRSRRMQKNGSINHKNPPFFHAYRRGTRVWCGGFSSLGNSVCQSRKDPPHHPHVTHSIPSVCPSVEWEWDGWGKDERVERIWLMVLEKRKWHITRSSFPSFHTPARLIRSLPTVASLMVSRNEWNERREGVRNPQGQSDYLPRFLRSLFTSPEPTVGRSLHSLSWSIARQSRSAALDGGHAKKE